MTMGKANAVCSTLMEGSFSSILIGWLVYAIKLADMVVHLGDLV